ncbi:MAG TPA: DnaD domain protein [Ktedonobacterales bacterium]|nr:DnaD domain protein [Ktedonobacterales bacterium]
MPAFSGFPAGKNPSVPLPEQFFTSLLPEIEDYAELKVTLHLFWLLAQKRGTPRCASERELAADPILRRSLRRKGDPRPPEERLRAGLESAVARGTLLCVRLRLDDELVSWYFFNTEPSRQAVAQLQEGELPATRLLKLEGPTGEAGAALAADMISVEIDRPNIFTLYEQNIGLLLPLVAEELKDAADQYPEDWILDAFREAVQQNKRNWSYIRAILRRWETEGKGGVNHGTPGRFAR